VEKGHKVILVCIHADTYSAAVLVLPRAPGWRVFFLFQGWARGASHAHGHWEPLSLQLLSPCASCLLHRMLIAQRFLGLGAVSKGGRGVAHLERLQPAEHGGCSVSAVGMHRMCTGGPHCVSGRASLLRV